MDISERLLERLKQLDQEIAAENENSLALQKRLLDATDPQQSILLEKVWERSVQMKEHLMASRDTLLAKLSIPGDVLGRPAATSSEAQAHVKEELIHQVPSAHKILQFCTAQRAGIDQHLLAGKRENESFKKKFPRSLDLVCSMDKSKPCLLWDALNNGQGSASLQQLVNWAQTPGALCMLYGPSGVGKTRSIFEVGSRVPCLYFTGMSEIESAAQAHGAADLRAIAEHLSMLFPEKDQAINVEALGCCVGALLCARLYIYQVVRQCKPEISNWEWLFLQVEFPGVTDIFYNLTKVLLAEFVLKESRFAKLACIFQEVVKQLVVQTRWDGFVAIDECQQVHRYLSARFNSLNQSCVRSMLKPLIFQIQRYSVHSVFLCGTGHSLLAIRSELASTSGTGKDFKVYDHNRFEGFYSVEAMKAYMRKYVDMAELDLEMLFQLYKGRFRFLVPALENYMVTSDDKVEVNKFFLTFASDFCTKPGQVWGHLRSVRDDVVKFMTRNPEAVKVVKDMAVAHYFGGAEAFLFAHRSSVKLVEYGLGRIVEVEIVGDDVIPIDDREGNVYTCDTQPVDDLVDEDEEIKRPFRAVIDEPLVLMCLLKHWRASKSWNQVLGEAFYTAADSASGIGERYERFVAPGVGQYFDGRAPVDMLSPALGSTAEVAEIYYEVCDLMRPKLVDIKPEVQTEQSRLRLGDWLAAIDGGNPLFSTYFHTGPNKSCGPDFLFMLKTRVSGTYLPVLCQVRSGAPKPVDALSSLSVEKLFKHNSGRKVDERDAVAVEKLQTLCKTGCLQLVITTPLEDLSRKQSVANLDKKVSSRGKEKGNAGKGKGNAGAGNVQVRPLLGFVDEHNAHLFIEDWCRELIEAMKPKRARKS